MSAVKILLSTECDADGRAALVSAGVYAQDVATGSMAWGLVPGVLDEARASDALRAIGLRRTFAGIWERPATTAGYDTDRFGDHCPQRGHDTSAAQNTRHPDDAALHALILVAGPCVPRAVEAGDGTINQPVGRLACRICGTVLS